MDKFKCYLRLVFQVGSVEDKLLLELSKQKNLGAMKDLKSFKEWLLIGGIDKDYGYIGLSSGKIPKEFLDGTIECDVHKTTIDSFYLKDSD